MSSNSGKGKRRIAARPVNCWSSTLHMNNRCQKSEWLETLVESLYHNGNDLKKYEKGETRKAFGMTDFINPGYKSTLDLVKELTCGIGVDHCIECTGTLPLAQNGLESTKVGTGTTVLIGAGSKLNTEIAYLTMLNGRRLKGCLLGGIKVKSELPMIMQTCVDKGVKLDELLTHEISLDEVDQAFDLLKDPNCVKVLIKI